MHRHSLLFLREPAWHPVSVSRLSAPAGLHSWLEEPGSLTARLKGLAGMGFGVRLLAQRWARPFVGESALLGLPARRHAWVREVALHERGNALVLARTIIPPGTLRGSQCGLAHLGDRPLGELLFAHHGLRRSHLEAAKVCQEDWLCGVGRQFGHDSTVWGRRSLYQVGKASLLVCEFFLPHLFELENGPSR